MMNIFFLLAFFTQLEACRDTLWFQATVLSNTDELVTGKIRFYDQPRGEHVVLLQLASRTTSDARECAKLCYLSMSPICGSAVFKFEISKSSGMCHLFPLQFPCAIGRNLISSIDRIGSQQENVLLHCFYCNRFADGVDGREPVANQDSEPILENKESSPIQEFGVGKEQSYSRIIFRVMTFNTWIAGKNVRDGAQKIANHILTNDPHIVALQEIDEFTSITIRDLLNSAHRERRRPDTWHVCRQNQGGLNHILTRFAITQEYPASVYLKNNGCQVKILNQPPIYVDVWNVHLHWQDYGPYSACNLNNQPGMEDRLFYGEYKPTDPSHSRLHQTLRILHHKPVKDQDSLVVIMGDFNSPSHLDWTQSMARMHCNISYQWPVSKLMTDFGYVDAYRKFHDDPSGDPGVTWSPIYRTKTWHNIDSTESEPQDRIDFVYYSSGNQRVALKQAFVYKGTKTLNQFPYHFDNDWPSDHASVLTDFEITVLA